jgi:prepilin-type N-terminal cleavage/methylation domain-containing protein
VLRTRFEHADDDGFSLIEVIVGMSIFAIVAMAATSGFIAQIALDRANRGRVAAASIASAEIDEARATPVETLVTLPQRDTVVGGRTYHVNREVTRVQLGSTAGACEGGADNGSSLTVIRVTALVTWDGMGAVKPVRSDTQITPKATATANTYNIGVRLNDATNNPVGSQFVSLTGPSNQSVLTTSDGCAFFTGLPGGTYTATATRPDWVDSQGNANSQINVTVPSGSGVTTTVDLQFSPSAALELTMPGNNGFPLPADVPVTISNSSLLPTSRSIPGTGAVRTIPSLFPYAAGYDTWLGGCADADPAGVDAGNGNPYWPGAQRTAPIVALPAPPATQGAVDGAALQVHFERPDGTPVTGVLVTAVHDADSVCTAGESYPLTSGRAHGGGNGDGNNGNGNGNGGGNIADVGATLPYGTWRLEFGGAAVGSQTVVLAPGQGTNVVTVVVA